MEEDKKWETEYCVESLQEGAFEQGAKQMTESQSFCAGTVTKDGKSENIGFSLNSQIFCSARTTKFRFF